jgi:hypothetical protein
MREAPIVFLPLVTMIVHYVRFRELSQAGLSILVEAVTVKGTIVQIVVSLSDGRAVSFLLCRFAAHGTT